MTDPAANWERLLTAERHLLHLVSGTVFVGGTAAAMQADHRFSQDGDHVLLDLREHFGEVVVNAIIKPLKVKGNGCC